MSIESRGLGGPAPERKAKKTPPLEGDLIHPRDAGVESKTAQPAASDVLDAGSGKMYRSRAEAMADQNSGIDPMDAPVLETTRAQMEATERAAKNLPKPKRSRPVLLSAAGGDPGFGANLEMIDEPVEAKPSKRVKQPDSGISELDDPDRGTSRVLEQDTGVMDLENEGEAKEAAEAQFKGRKMKTIERKTQPQAEIEPNINAPRELAKERLTEMRELAEIGEQVSESWWKTMARSTVDIAKGAGSLWRTMTGRGEKSTQDPEFAPESMIKQASLEVVGNLKNMVTGGKQEGKMELEKGVEVDITERSLQGILARKAFESVSSSAASIKNSLEGYFNEAKQEISKMNLRDSLAEAKAEAMATSAASLKEAGSYTADYVKNVGGVLEFAKFVGGGVKDFFMDSGLGWAMEKYRQFDKQLNEGSFENQRQELVRQAAAAGLERLKVAEQEEREIAEQAEQAAQLLAETCQRAREQYEAKIDEAERALVRRNDLLNVVTNKKTRGQIQSDMMRLERDLDGYEAALASLDKLDKLTPETRKESAQA